RRACRLLRSRALRRPSSRRRSKQAAREGQISRASSCWPLPRKVHTFESSGHQFIQSHSGRGRLLVPNCLCLLIVESRELTESLGECLASCGPGPTCSLKESSGTVHVPHHAEPE